MTSWIKKYCILIGFSGLFSGMVSAQKLPNDQEEKLKQTDIELVYNQYFQDGNHSAITGGTGTEKLTVYGPSLKVKTAWKNHALSVHAGSDIISSASTDNIDFVKSSASALDMRSFANVNYHHQNLKEHLTFSIGANFSMESDYLSIGENFGITKENKEKTKTYSLGFQMFQDDLRWGRLSPSRGFKPTLLVYPKELRDTAWHQEYKRYSYHLKLGYSQVVNKRNILGIYPEIIYQNGLLATPFHRVYFRDESLRVEQLPKQRWKGTLALKCNTFVGGRFILKHTLNGYWDNFNILAFSIQNETAIKLQPKWTLSPNFRFYHQKGSPYFAPHKEHSPDAQYYSSDYDLSTFETYTLGLGVKYIPFQYWNKRLLFQGITLRYNYMYRTDGLQGHILSLVLKATWK